MKAGICRIVFILLVCFLVCSVHDVWAQRGHIPPGLADRYIGENTFGVHFRYMPHVSYGLANTSFPFAKSYPQYLSDMMGLDLVFFFSGNKLQHHLRTSLSLPAYIYSEAQSETGYYVDRYKSSGQRHQQVYYFNLPLWKPGFLSLWYGVTVSLQYEKRSIQYYSDRIDNKWNAGMGLGPNMAIDLPLFRGFAIRGEGHFLGFLPYTSLGNVETSYGRSTHYESGFHSFTLVPFADIQGRFRIFEELLLVLGYRNIVQMGYGHVRPSFSSQGMIAYSFDEIQEFYAGFRYTMPARWTRRKTNPACPLQRP